MARTKQETTDADDVYARLSAPFDEEFKDIRGGVELTYVTGEQVITRLNEVLGMTGWTFDVIEHGWREDADEYWSLGKLTVYWFKEVTVNGVIDAKPITITRMQFGSQKVKRSRANGNPLDIGFDLKGATTDALKKCASLIGVGLYLSHKEAKARGETPLPKDAAPMQQGVQNGAAASEAQVLFCEDCGEPLLETKFKDGTVWSPLQLQGFGTRKYGKTLDMNCYRNAKRLAEAGTP